MPILPQLARMLDDAGPKNAAVCVINEETQQPYKANNFRHVFAEIRGAAGIDKIARRHGIAGGLLFMDLRRTAVCIWHGWLLGSGDRRDHGAFGVAHGVDPGGISAARQRDGGRRDRETRRVAPPEKRTRARIIHCGCLG